MATIDCIVFYLTIPLKYINFSLRLGIRCKWAFLCFKKYKPIIDIMVASNTFKIPDACTMKLIPQYWARKMLEGVTYLDRYLYVK